MSWLKNSLIFVAFASLAGCQTTQHTTVKSFSGHNLTTDIVIPEGWVQIADAKHRSEWETLVREQVKYLSGQFRAQGGIVDLSQLEIDVAEGTSVRLDQIGVSYAAKVPVTWTGHKTLPKVSEALLPRRTDREGRMQFFTTFHKSCRIEVSTPAQYWYNFAWQGDRCESSPGRYNKVVAIGVPILMSPRQEKKHAVTPHLENIWADRQLSVLSIFDREFALGGKLPERILSRLKEAYGEPAISAGDLLRKYTWQLPQGRSLVWSVMVKDKEAPVAAVSERRTADVVFDVGEQSLREMWTRTQAWRQSSSVVLIVANGRGSFPYVDSRVTAAAAGSLQTDFVAIAVPTYKQPNSQSHIAIMTALIDGVRTYEQIFTEFDSDNAYAAAGMEDNPDVQMTKEKDFSLNFFD